MSIPEGQADDKTGEEGGWGALGPERTQEQPPGRSYESVPEPTLLERFFAMLHDWVLMTCLVLLVTLGIGAGIIIGREDAGEREQLWIEQLPAELVVTGASSSVAEQKSQPENGFTDTPQRTSDSALGAAAVVAIPAQTGTYVASKSGTKYYLPTCAAAKRIKEENRVWFATKAAAEAAGYAASTACKGL